MRVPLGVIGDHLRIAPQRDGRCRGPVPEGRQCRILRGGSEAIAFEPGDRRSACMKGLQAAGLPETAVQVIETTDRAAVGELITMNDYVDMIVPRGGKGLIERADARIAHSDDQASATASVTSTSTIRPISTRRSRIADNAKTQRLGTCNTMETLLVARGIAAARAAAACARSTATKASSCAATRARARSCRA